MSVYSGLKCCLSILDVTGFRVLKLENFYLLLLSKTLRLLDVFQLLIMCAKTLIFLGKLLLLKKHLL